MLRIASFHKPLGVFASQMSMFNTVRFSTLHRRDVERTELPSTRQCRIIATFSCGSRTSALKGLRRLAEALTALLALEPLDAVFTVITRFDHLVRQLWHVTWTLAFFGHGSK